MLPEENKLLAPFTTLGIGGPARWFVAAESEDEIAEAVAWAGERGLSLFVLGGGSNLLVSDAGFDGLVLQVGLRGIHVAETENLPEQVVYRVAAGEDWDGFVERAVKDKCAGIECLAGIPGTVGGTPVQNVGAYGQEVASAITRVRAFDLETHTFVELAAAECGFGYRRSRFNSTDRGRYIVTRVDYRLTPGGVPTLRYADLQRAVPAGSEASLIEVTEIVRRIRQSKGMLLVEGEPDCRSAGSFFKNPVVTVEQVRRIAAICMKEPPRFPAGPEPENLGRVKVPAAWLIEQSGFGKGYVLGAAGVSSRHTLALINRGGATAQEILELAGRITDAVEAQFDIRLAMEPVMVGFQVPCAHSVGG
jgi:UDP-N-acetylmuramate dehydrogenase